MVPVDKDSAVLDPSMLGALEISHGTTSNTLAPSIVVNGPKLPAQFKKQNESFYINFSGMWDPDCGRGEEIELVIELGL